MHQECFTLIKIHKECTVNETDKWVKGIKQMIKEEAKNSLSEVCFMVEQLQMETQQDLKGYHSATVRSTRKLSETAMAMNEELKQLTANMRTVESEEKTHI